MITPKGPERICGLQTTGGDCPEFLPTDYVRADVAANARAKGAAEERAKYALTERQRSALRSFLAQIGSWTSARFDQHLRYNVGDDDADAIIKVLSRMGVIDKT